MFSKEEKPIRFFLKGTFQQIEVTGGGGPQGWRDRAVDQRGHRWWGDSQPTTQGTMDTSYASYSCNDQLALTSDE